jgi:hypothetical protein
MKRTFFVKRELRELSVLARPRLSGKRFCEGCQEDVRWLFPEEAMALAGTSLRGIFQLVESSRIHFAENEKGFLLVCAASLAAKQK